MRRRLAVLLSGLLVLSCGGGGHGPTEPAAVPQVAGLWIGGWAPEGSPFGLGTTMTLTQIERMKYVLSNGVKEGLAARPGDWPGIHGLG
jgi:hypothetical protein